MERELSEREETGGGGGRGKIEGSEIARISRIFGFYAFLGIDTSVRRTEQGFYTAMPSIDVHHFPVCSVCAWQRERERKFSLSSEVSFTDIVQRRFMVERIAPSRNFSTCCFDFGKLALVGSGGECVGKEDFWAVIKLFSAILILFGEIFMLAINLWICLRNKSRCFRCIGFGLVWSSLTMINCSWR